MYNSESFFKGECYCPQSSALFVTYTNTSDRYSQSMYWLSRECTDQVTTPFGDIPYVCHAQVVKPRETIVYTFPGTGNGFLLKHIDPRFDMFALINVVGGERYNSTAFRDSELKPLRKFFFGI